VILTSISLHRLVGCGGQPRFNVHFVEESSCPQPASVGHTSARIAIPPNCVGHIARWIEPSGTHRRALAGAWPVWQRPHPPLLLATTPPRCYSALGATHGNDLSRESDHPASSTWRRASPPSRGPCGRGWAACCGVGDNRRFRQQPPPGPRAVMTVSVRPHRVRPFAGTGLQSLILGRPRCAASRLRPPRGGRQAWRTGCLADGLYHSVGDNQRDPRPLRATDRQAGASSEPGCRS
jgi:hypothetical protein